MALQPFSYLTEGALDDIIFLFGVDFFANEKEKAP
jgi:hypothetical protein